MKLEHFALNVPHPLEMADWYVNNLNLKIVRQLKDSPFTTFIADDSGRVMIEIYKNTEATVPDYRSYNPLMMHLAFVSEDPEADREQLLSAGASFESEIRTEDGSHLIMLRDPWGIPLQLCKRAIKMLEAEPSAFWQ